MDDQSPEFIAEIPEYKHPDPDPRILRPGSPQRLSVPCWWRRGEPVVLMRPVVTIRVSDHARHARQVLEVGILVGVVDEADLAIAVVRNDRGSPRIQCYPISHRDREIDALMVRELIAKARTVEGLEHRLSLLRSDPGTIEVPVLRSPL